jgi:hypothetical protein
MDTEVQGHATVRRSCSGKLSHSSCLPNNNSGHIAKSSVLKTEMALGEANLLGRL